jgi:hypothetical protein
MPIDGSRRIGFIEIIGAVISQATPILLNMVTLHTRHTTEPPQTEFMEDQNYG